LGAFVSVCGAGFFADCLNWIPTHFCSKDGGALLFTACLLDYFDSYYQSMVFKPGYVNAAEIATLVNF